MAKVIIGIHGLANKPKKDTLTGWWRKSIREGLKHNCAVGNPRFTYDMVYWADLLHVNPQHTVSGFEFDQLYNRQPYYAADPKDLKAYRDTVVDDVRVKVLGWLGAGIDGLRRAVGRDPLADWALGKMLKDLAFYYDDDRKIKNRQRRLELARTVLRNELKAVILHHRQDDVMLIAHSMGSIIAYDVLRDLGQDHPELSIAHFVTIGAPLGLPHVKHHIVEERGYDPTVRTPSVVTKSWMNFADRRDPVALDTHLRDDYQANMHGVRAQDDLVRNDYVEPQSEPAKSNPHKSYGYLRTPELSQHVHDFLR
ncbi:MAG: alpha/beta hydrolase [Planctomycetes bacterium]|nr:alpha/beta hydrolase [Planctomycetota bacterium]